MKIKCTNVKYDISDEQDSPKLPKTVTVEVNDDMFGCCIEAGYDGEPDVPDWDEMGEMIEDAVEEKIGYPVLECRVSGSLRG